MTGSLVMELKELFLFHPEFVFDCVYTWQVWFDKKNCLRFYEKV